MNVIIEPVLLYETEFHEGDTTSEESKKISLFAKAFYSRLFIDQEQFEKKIFREKFKKTNPESEVKKSKKIIVANEGDDDFDNENEG